MTVSITWKVNSGGWAAATAVDHGAAAAGSILTAQEIEISHDGNNQLSACKFYLAEYSGTYTGATSPNADYTELLNWGAQTAIASFGGFQINMDSINSYPSAKWPAYNDHYDMGTGEYMVFHSDDGTTTRGTTVTDAILLSKSMSDEMSVDGVIPANMTTWPRFKARVQIPADEGVVGIRQFEQKMRFTFTS